MYRGEARVFASHETRAGHREESEGIRVERRSPLGLKPVFGRKDVPRERDLDANDRDVREAPRILREATDQELTIDSDI